MEDPVQKKLNDMTFCEYLVRDEDYLLLSVASLGMWTLYRYSKYQSRIVDYVCTRNKNRQNLVNALGMYGYAASFDDGKLLIEM